MLTTPDLHLLTNDKLRDLVNGTETTLNELKRELERRDELGRHHEIANLDNHLRSAELSLQSIRNFLAHVTEEMKVRG